MTQTYVLKKPLKKTSRRLKLMGLNPKVVVLKNEGYIIIPLQQILDLLKRKAQNPYSTIDVVLEENNIVVKVWKKQTV